MTASAAKQLDDEARAQRILFDDPTVIANVAQFADRREAARPNG